MTGDHDKQTEETLLADNVDVEEESEEKVKEMKEEWEEKATNN